MMEIKQVILQTNTMNETKRFYTDTLGFSLIKEEEEMFCVAIGSSEMVFAKTDEKVSPYYHFAFNIQSNKFDEAKSWVKERVNLNKEDGKDEADFSFLQAHSLYFYDPSGNIVEFISRHAISEADDKLFSSKSILNIGEISLTVPDVQYVGQQLIDIGINERNNRPLSTTSLNFMGDKTTGAFILLVQPGRRWIFSDKISAVFPVEIILASGERITLNEQGFNIN